MRLILTALLACCWLFAGPAAAQESVFKLGVAPHTSTRVILEMYQPLRQHLERQLGMPVSVETAPDFTEFGRRALAQQYDLAITTGHQARLYQTDAGYIPLITYLADFKAVALVARNGRLRQPADLAGQTVLGLSPSSLVTLWGLHWLENNKLRDKVTVRYVSAADSVSQQVLAGDAAMAFTSQANFDKLPPDTRNALHIFAESEPMAGRVYLLNKRRAALQAQVEQALQSFAASPEGRNYFAQNKLDGYRKLKPRELEAMEPYANETRKVLKGQ